MILQMSPRASGVETPEFAGFLARLPFAFAQGKKPRPDENRLYDGF